MSQPNNHGDCVNGFIEPVSRFCFQVWKGALKPVLRNQSEIIRFPLLTLSCFPLSLAIPPSLLCSTQYTSKERDDGLVLVLVKGEVCGLSNGTPLAGTTRFISISYNISLLPCVFFSSFFKLLFLHFHSSNNFFFSVLRFLSQAKTPHLLLIDFCLHLAVFGSL